MAIVLCLLLASLCIMKKVFIFDIQGLVVSHVGDDRDKKMNGLNGLTPSVEEHSFDISAHFQK